MENILEIMLDKGRFRTNYFVVSIGKHSDKFFESKSPLKEAKEYAKNHGFKYLKVISITLSKPDKVYSL